MVLQGFKGLFGALWVYNLKRFLRRVLERVRVLTVVEYKGPKVR